MLLGLSDPNEMTAKDGDPRANVRLAVAWRVMCCVCSERADETPLLKTPPCCVSASSNVCIKGQARAEPIMRDRA